MINVSQAIKNSCKADKNTHTEYIVINGQTIYIKGKLSATAYKDTTFFGTFNMKVLEFETENTTQFRNREFEYYKVIDGNAFKVGTFITTEVVDNDSKDTIKVTANDYALKFAVPYTSELDYGSGEITLYDVLEECCSQVGVELENKFIDNNSFKVDSNQFVNGELVGDVICAIAGISGNFATITNEDKLRLTFTNGTGAEQTTTIDGATQINASGFKDIDLLGNTTQDGTPTPSNPVNVETITGRNTIDVCGKNLFTTGNGTSSRIGVNATYNGSEVVLNGTTTSAGNIFYDEIISLNTGYRKSQKLPAGTYTLSTKTTGTATYPSGVGIAIYIRDGSGNILKSFSSIANYQTTLILNSETQIYSQMYINGSGGVYNNYSIHFQIEKGSTATTYEPYIGNSYEINLGKNLFDINTITPSKFISTSNGGLQNNDNWCQSDYINVEGNTNYTISNSNVMGGNGRIEVSEYNGSTWLRSRQVGTSTMTYFVYTTLENTTRIRVGIYKINDVFINVQVEKGSTASSYSSYFEPIELCKIGTYQDRLFKATGKNLWNIKNGTYTTNGITGVVENGKVILNGTATANAFVQIPINVNINWDTTKTYIVSAFNPVANSDVRLRINNSGGMDTILSSTNASASRIPNNSDMLTNIIAIRVASGTTLTNFVLYPMLELETTIGKYEPYEKGWYKYNAIGKVVLNGSESWYFTSNCCYTNNIVDVVKRPPNNTTKADIICDHYILDTLANCYNNVNDKRISVNNGGYLYIYDTSFTSANAIKTWLASNNTIVYYVLATPTYTKIENEELIGQLDSIKTLDLFDGINNITTNAPFFLTYLDGNVEILEDYTNLDDKRDTQPITSVSIGTSQVEGQEAILRDESLIAQYGEHWLVINDNPFAYTLEKRQQLVKAIFDKVKGFGYSSFKSEYSYRPYLELGDKIKFKNKNGDLIDSTILRYNFDFDNCTFEAPSITSATINYELSPDANELAKRAEIIANQAEVSITSITQELQIDADGNSQVIESIKTTQTQNSLDIEAITSYQEIDGERVLTGVKTGKGFTFNNSGLIITNVNEENTYKTKIDETGTYYYDGETILGQTTNEGSKFKNMDLYGEFHYGMGEITDKPLFVSMKFSETNNGTTEQCFGHFWDGD